MDVQKLIEEVKAMSVLELNELVKALEAEFGVSAAAPVAAAGAAGAAEAAPAAEEKTEFDVVLKDIGPNKIAIIKNGELIRCGALEEVRGDSSLEELFLELTE